MKNKRITKLNQLLGESLGFVSNQPRYAWKRTSELFYFLRNGTTEIETAGGLFLVVPKYDRHSWAAKIGDDLWILAKWDFPRMSEREWEYSSLNREFPYPHKGQYYAIENAMPGSIGMDYEPTERDTRMVIDRIRTQESADPTKVLAECKAEAEKPFNDKKSQFSDRVDDFWPAFDNQNASDSRLGSSRGGHVSFGGM